MTLDDATDEVRVWRAVMRRVRWFTFILAFAGNILAVATVAGWYASDIYQRLEKIDTRSTSNQERISTIEVRQYKADAIAARVDERLIGLSEQLDRIERSTEKLAEELRRQ